jgi:hypothetical protein
MTELIKVDRTVRKENKNEKLCAHEVMKEKRTLRWLFLGSIVKSAPAFDKETRLSGLRFIEELRSCSHLAHCTFGPGRGKKQESKAEDCRTPLSTSKSFSSRLLSTSASLLCCCFAFAQRTVFDFGLESFFVPVETPLPFAFYFLGKTASRVSSGLGSEGPAGGRRPSALRDVISWDSWLISTVILMLIEAMEVSPNFTQNSLRIRAIAVFFVSWRFLPLEPESSRVRRVGITQIGLENKILRK